MSFVSFVTIEYHFVLLCLHSSLCSAWNWKSFSALAVVLASCNFLSSLLLPPTLFFLILSFANWVVPLFQKYSWESKLYPFLPIVAVICLATAAKSPYVSFSGISTWSQSCCPSCRSNTGGCPQSVECLVWCEWTATMMEKMQSPATLQPTDALEDIRMPRR